MKCKIIDLNGKSIYERERLIGQWLALGYRLVCVDNNLAYLTN